MKHIALIYANANYRRILMNNMFLYFAYGSNMNPARMAKRCPGAIALGGAVLLNHRLTERLYADIDFVSGATVEGVLYLISEANLARLDACEGYPKVYRRLWLEVEFDGGIYQAIPTKCPGGQSSSAAEKVTLKSTAKSVLSEQNITE